MPPSSSARIVLCGALTAQIEGRDVARALPAGRGVLLFAYLVCNRGRPVTRDELIDVLWPDRRPDNPDAALSTLLTRLRRGLGGALARGTTRLQLELGPEPWIDVEVANARARAAEVAATERLPTEALAAAREALELIQQPFLAAADGDWVDVERQGLARLRTQLLERLARAALELGDPYVADAEQAALQLIAAEPFRETGYELAMRVHSARGNVAEALLVHERLRVLLREELGAAPAPAIAALHEQLLRHETSAAVRPPRERVPLPAAIRAATASPLVGRRRELALLRGLWQEVVGGGARIVVVAGEPGIGKSRLAAELAAESHAGGATVLRGRCDEDPIVPYQPLVEALRHLARHASIGTEGSLQELARLVPEVGAAGSDAGNGAAARRYRLFEEVVEVLTRAAHDRPLLLVVDDLQWLDTPTRLLLRHLTASPPDRMLLLATHRDTERSPEFATLVSDLRRESRVERVPLTGLDAAAVAELVEYAGASDADPAFVGVLRSTTEGNPLFIGEILRGLGRSGDDSGAAYTPEALARTGLPEGVEEAIDLRLDRLSEPTRRRLRGASVAGPEFALELLAQVLDEPAEEVLDSLEEAIAARLLVETPGAPDRFAFAHALVREVLYGRQSQSRRARLHLRLGQALERSGATRAAEIAHHFFEAGPLAAREQAVAYGVAAAREADELLAYEDAVVHYERALDLLPPGEERRLEVLLALGGALERAGAVEESRARFIEGADEARRRSAPTALAEAALGFAKWKRYGEADPVAVELLEAAAAALGDAGTALQARVLGLLAVRLDPVEAQERREQLRREAVALARLTGDDEALSAVLSFTQFVIWRADCIDERLQAAAEGIRLARARGQREWALWARLSRFVDLLTLGRIDAADVELNAYEALARELRLPWFRWHSTAVSATRRAFSGDLAAGGELARAAYELRQRHDPDADETFVAQTFMLAAATGRPEEVDRARVRGLVERYPRLPVWKALAARVATWRGDDDEARALLDQCARDGFRAARRNDDALVSLALLGEVAAALQDGEAAQALYDALVPHARLNLVFEQAWAAFGSLSRQLGLLAAALGRPADAARHLADALEANAAMGAAPWLARAALDYAQLAVEPEPRVEPLLDAGLEQASRLGLAPTSAPSRGR